MNTNIIQASVTRPADTIPYTAGDVVGSIFQFDGVAPKPGQGALIESAIVVSGAFVALGPELELFLFTATQADLDADNAPYTPTDAQMLTLAAWIPFPAASFRSGDLTAGAGGNQMCMAPSVGIAVRSDSLYGVLVARNAHVPVSAGTFAVILGIIR